MIPFDSLRADKHSFAPHLDYFISFDRSQYASQIEASATPAQPNHRDYFSLNQGLDVAATDAKGGRHAINIGQSIF
jgi:hypothetical protein